ncbi:MAG: cytidylyltransferase domain-containing protein [Planctomycetota bacterium]
MTTAVIIQARMGSTRLRGKVLMDIAGLPMLEHVVRRAKAARGVDRVCVATTSSDQDSGVVRCAEQAGAETFRGSESNVLSRYVGAARALDAELVVRVTSDCPLLDPGLLEEMLDGRAELVARSGAVDHYSNILRRTYPRGLDLEILPRSVLEQALAHASDPRALEHVTWDILRQPEIYSLENHAQPKGRDDSELRLTVDTEADLEFVRRIHAALGGNGRLFGREEVMALLERQPSLASINAAVEQKEA